MLPSIPIDEELELRFAHPGLAEPLFQLLEAERVHLSVHIPWVDRIRSLEEGRRFLKESELFTKGKQKLFTFIIYRKELVGSVALPRINSTHQVAELGFWLKKELEGNRLISRSCRALLQYAFKRLPLNRVEVRIPSRNQYAMRIPEALGFRHEGTLRKAVCLQDTYHDVEIFGLLRSEWEAELL